MGVGLSGTLPDDAKAARVFSDGWSGVLGDPSPTNPKKVLRSKLYQAARDVAMNLHKTAQKRRHDVVDPEEQNR